MEQKKIPLVILSYSRYKTIWKDMFTYWDKYSQYFDVYLLSDWDNVTSGKIKNYIPSNYISSFLISKEKNWAAMLLDGLNMLKKRDISIAMFTFDDLKPQSINISKLEKLYDLFCENNIVSLKLAHYFQQEYNKKDMIRMNIGNKKYLTTLVYSFWRIDYLYSLANKGLNPWEFEMYGYKEIKELDRKKIASVNTPVIKYKNLIVKGYKLPFLNKKYDFPTMNIFTYLFYESKLLLIEILKKTNIKNFYK